ncbi:MAG: NADPH-dependent FMN reductase [Candidatus Nanohaloarchaea archaeon]
MHFLIVVGSTREGRQTGHAARAVKKMFDREHETELFDLKEKNIPFLGSRTYTDEGEPPEDIREFSEKVRGTDCVVIVSPEYNHSIPGVLKNALDYLYPEYDDKPFCYVTTSGGGFGGVRALSHLHDITLALGGHPGPNLPISNVGDAFDDKGKIMDEEYRRRLKDYVEDSAEHAERFQ